MIIKDASIITFDDSYIEKEYGDKLENCDIHMYYYHIRPPNFDLTSKSVHFFVKFLKNVIDFIHGIESGYRMCCILAYLRGKAELIIPKHQYFCHNCLIKIKYGEYKDRKRLAWVKRRFKLSSNKKYK